jgi:hypothetical protein
VPETTKSIFNIAQLVTNEKRAGLKNFHVINLLPNTLRPLPWYMHGSRALRDAYMLRIPALAHPQLRVDFFLSKALSKRLFAAAKLPKGLRVTKLAASDLAQLKQYWLKNEMRNDASWESLLKTFDVSQQFSVDPRSKGADLPVSIKAGAREDFMLLVRSGKLKPAERGSLAIFTLQQTNAQGEVVGGSTFVFKPVKSDG